MTSIPPHIAGALFQTQIAANQVSKKDQARRAKQDRDSRALAQLADQQEHEVEHAEQTEHVRVHRRGEQSRDSSQQGDTFERELHNAEQSAENQTDDARDLANVEPIDSGPAVAGSATRESVNPGSSAPKAATIDSAAESAGELATESAASTPAQKGSIATPSSPPDDTNSEEPHHIDLSA